jgi:catechol 2,3-dioxygenase-like lactoylglutathione lyase family enzyme
MLTSFDHVTVAVRDLGAAVENHRRLLGSEPIWQGTSPELGTRTALFGFSNGLLELVAPDAQAPEAEGLRTWLEAHGDGLASICFGTADATACSAELRGRGVRATPPQPGSARSTDGAIRHYELVELSPRSARGLTVAIVQRSAALFGPETSAADPGAVHALDHVVVRTADPDAAIQLYEKGLGIRLALDRTFGDIRMLFFRIGGVTLEVVEDRGLGAADALYGLAYRVRDIDAANARLRAAAFDVSEVREGRKPGTQVFTVRAKTSNVPTLILRDPSRK